ncbi:MAG: GIY-YIG nuclease family protein, partial [bacterium]|nr:GIY-YIG nuclease family protein [bacterium]
YVGQTADLPKRLEQHNSGLSLWTKRRTNWSVIFFEIFATRREALTREKWLKSGVGRDFLKNVSREGS